MYLLHLSPGSNFEELYIAFVSAEIQCKTRDLIFKRNYLILHYIEK